MARPKQFDQEEILQKAKCLFWKQGFHATSIQDLVDHLGINRASIYDTFGGKNKLYETALIAYQNEQRAFLKEEMTQFESPRKNLEHFLEKIFLTKENPENDGCFIVNCTTEYLPQHPTFLKALLENKDRFVEFIASIIADGQAKGEIAIKHKPNEIALYIFTFISGQRVVSKLSKDSKNNRKTLKLVLEILN